MIRLALALCALLLAACGADPVRVPQTTLVQSDLRDRASVSTVMLREVSLPTYAAAEEVAVQAADGTIQQNPDILWADEPARFVTLQLTQHLNVISTATVAPEPWPLDDIPDVTVDVRVSRMLATNSGTFDLTGQFFVGGDGRPFRANATPFVISVPLGAAGIEGIPQAQAAAVLQLAETIARAL